MKSKIILAIIVLLNGNMALHATKPSFYLINNKAKMPVVIRGKTQSDVLIVFLHGGPGGTAIKKIGTRAFQKLEEDFGVVYWNQRGADQSKGGTQKKYLNLYQFTDDLDQLVNLLQVFYPKSKIFLMGHCWGGALATAYLANKHRQEKITGFINVAGAYNNPKADSLSMEWVKEYARKMIALGSDVKYWQKALSWYSKNPDFNSDQLAHYNFLRKASGYQKIKGDSLGIFPCYTTGDIFKRPVQFLSYYLNYYRTLNKFIISEIDLSGHMQLITIPSLILWGNNDGLVPLKLGTDAHALLGTPDNQKHLVIFENTGHTIYYEQPVLFPIVVKGFIRGFAPPQSPVTQEKIVNF